MVESSEGRPRPSFFSGPIPNACLAKAPRNVSTRIDPITMDGGVKAAGVGLPWVAGALL